MKTRQYDGIVARSADRLDDLEQLALDVFVAGDDLAVPDGAGGARIVGDDAAGLADQQVARGHVPRLQPGFPVAVEAAGGEPGEVGGGRAGAADTGDGRGHLRQLLQL